MSRSWSSPLRRRTARLAAVAAVVAAAGCGAVGPTTDTASTTEPIITTPTPALVARGRTLTTCLERAGFGGEPAQLTPIDLRTAVVGVTLTGLPVADGTRADGGGIVWLFETAADAEESVRQVTAPVPGIREQYIDGAAIVILYAGTDGLSLDTLERCVGEVSDPPPAPADG